ncbi:MAG TPA: hypothetical protein VHF50_03180 [Solirubrobacterales bacterium]|nr:hypothetical protein [Solirubrobacterales bacterium]
MRDPLLNEALKRLAAEAATRFTTLVASGEQIPFDVAETEGPDSLFHSYVPLTARFVRAHEDELRTLPAFEPAREAVDLAGIAAPYLEQRGETVPPRPAERAARMLTVFLASLWDGCAEFALDRDRLDNALAVLDAEIGDVDEADVIVAPIVGLRMPVGRLEVARGVQIVRADSIDAPVEAMRSEGMNRAAWEPQFLAVAEQGDGPESAGAALQQLHELISVMRLFKRGGVALGPYAFAPTGEGHWRRLVTGAAAPRDCGYRLSKEETAELARLASELETQPDPSGPLAWAVRRFELGCERPTALEGLSDHLLALRAVLDGQGPVGASLPMRAAALIADGSMDRLTARERLEEAMEVERAVMAGASGIAALEMATWVEDGVRRILRDAALGELGGDLNEAADETLIATGLVEGDHEVAVSVQTGLDPGVSGRSQAEPGSPVADAPREDMPGNDETKRSTEPGHDLTLPGPDEGRAEHHEWGQEESMEDTRILEPVPAEDEIRITATNWLDEVEVEESTLDFPAIEGDVAHRERIDTPRVRHLFPVPDDADWDVGELRYDHYDRRHAG